MKNILFVPIALALVASLAACASDTQTTSSRENIPLKSQSAPEKASVSLTKDWHDYTAKDGSYSAKFPGQPKVSDKSEDVQVTYEDTTNNRLYTTISSQLPPGNPSPEAIERILNSGVTNAKEGKTLIDEKKISLRGLPGREVTTRDKQGMVTTMKFFFNPQKPALYLAMVQGSGNLDFPEAQVFFDSLSITPK